MIQLTLALKMTTSQVVKMPIQGYIYPHNHIHLLIKCFSLIVFRVLEACKSWTQFLHGLTSWITWHKFLFTHQNFHHSFINPRDDQCGSITINRDFIKNRFEAITMVNMETSAVHKTKKLLREEKRY